MINRIFVNHTSGKVSMSVDARQIIYRERISILKPVFVRYVKRCQELGLDPAELEIKTDKGFAMKGCQHCCSTSPVEADEKICPRCGKEF